MNTKTLPEPLCKDVAYGPDEVNTYDLWKAREGVTPLFVFIHGGGWTSGDKYNSLGALLPLFLEAGISYATIGYRYSTVAPLPAPIHDAGRAVQHIRMHAAEYGIDPDRLATYGGSAGACTSLNLALGPDMARPSSDNPMERQSSRPSCAGGRNGQTALDPVLLREWVGDDILQHRMPNLAVDEETADGMLERYEQHRRLLQLFSPYLQVDAETAVPIWQEYTRRNELAVKLPAQGSGAAIHHSEMGRRLKQKMDAMGLECHLALVADDDPRPIAGLEFFKEKLLGQAVGQE